MAAEPGEGFRWGAVKRRSRLDADGTEGSTPRQERAIFEYVKANNMGRIVAQYTDIASGHDEKAKRENFDNALMDLQAGRIDGLIAWKWDRFTRRRSVARRLLVLAEECGGRLATVVEGIDTADPGKREITEIVLAVYAGSAEAESEAISERVMLMHQERARQGLPHRSQVRPFGHTLDWFALVPHEVELLNDAARRIIAGGNRFAICKEWEANGVPTVMGKRWHGETLKNILVSPRMVGKREFGGSLFDLEDVPPILDMETWERVRHVLCNGQTPRGRVPRRQVSGIMLCGDCETPVVGNVEGPHKRNPHKRETVYCRKRHAYPKACGGVSALAAHVDAVIADRVCEFLNDRERVTSLLRQHAKGEELDALHALNEQLNESLVALDEARFNPPPGIRRLPDDRYYAQLRAIYAKRDELNRRLAVTREAALLTEALNVEWTPELWGDQDLAWRRAILKLVTLRITLHRATKRGGTPGVHGGLAFDPERVRIRFAS